MKQILILHGPNLNLLGEREPEIYGGRSLRQIEAELESDARGLDLEVRCVQSNHEGVLIDALQEARGRIDGAILNPGGLTHTSVSLRDAVAASPFPVIEVHLSNLFSREAFRRNDLIAPVCAGTIMGLGALSYRAALWALHALLAVAGGDSDAGG